MPEYLENWKKQNLEKQRNKKGLFSLFLIHEDDTQLSLQLWRNLDCISEVDCVQRLIKKGRA